MDQILGSIALFGFGFVPRGWAACDGSSLSISQNSALFSLLGTTYGGDGVNTFALPDLRGRIPLGQGQGQGLSPQTLGAQSGTENVTLTSSQMPMHNHALSASTASANSATPTGALLAMSNGALEDGTGVTDNTYINAPVDTTLNSASIGNAGGNTPFSVMQPYLVMNYCIAVEGVFPSRS